MIVRAFGGPTFTHLFAFMFWTVQNAEKGIGHDNYDNSMVGVLKGLS